MSIRISNYHRYYWFCLILIYCLQIVPIQASTVELNQVYELDEAVFLQGLELDEQGRLIISTGLYGESMLGEISPENGHISTLDTLEDHYFGEGITFSPNSLWQLTWQEQTVMKRDPNTFVIIEKFPMQEEGWGLAYDPHRNVLWHSDGTDKIYQRNPDNFNKIDALQVTEHGKPVDLLNELEYANGAIYANIWYSTDIVQINPETGEIMQRFDLAPLLDSTMTTEELEAIDSLNGIAHIDGNRFYITGKLYPYLYEVTLCP
ncbi:glutaminyl-peptide cyclotransferase [Aerococcaceae bacterium DSM 111020]|nr:glutaminyl-peptide cyclotransferase [Aerococcaceae bacterium DSM 111020]